VRFLDGSLVLSVLRAGRCERLTPHLMAGKRSLITRLLAAGQKAEIWLDRIPVSSQA